MKKFIFLTFIVFFLFEKVQSQDTTSFEFAQVYYKKSWRMIDRSGNFIFSEKFGVGSTQNLCLSEQLLRFENNGKIGFKDLKDSMIIPSIYDEAHCFELGLAPVALNNKWGIIDRTNKFLVGPQYEYAGSFGADSLAPVFQDGKLGFINLKGELVIPCKYFWYPSMNVEPKYPIFSEKLLPVAFEQYDEEDTIMPKMGFIDTKGRVIIEARFDFSHSYFEDGKAIVSENRKCGMINKSGNYIIPPKFDHWFYFTEGLAVVHVDDLVGVIDEKGNYVLEPRNVNGINPYKDGFAIVQIKSTENGVVSAFLDRNGKYAFGKEFGFIQDFNEGMAAVEINGKWGYIDSTGNLVIPAIYKDAKPFQNGLAVVANDSFRYGFIDKNGRLVIPCEYHDANNFEFGLAPVKKGKKFGFINNRNEFVIKPKFKNAFGFQKEIIRIN